MCVKRRGWSSAAGTVLVLIPTQDGPVRHFATAFRAQPIWAISGQRKLSGTPLEQPWKASLHWPPGPRQVTPLRVDGRHIPMSQRCSLSILHPQWDSARVTLGMSPAPSLTTLETQNVLLCLSSITLSFSINTLKHVSSVSSSCCRHRVCRLDSSLAFSHCGRVRLCVGAGALRLSNLYKPLNMLWSCAHSGHQMSRPTCTHTHEACRPTCAHTRCAHTTSPGH